MQQEKILIFGGAGYVGSHFVAAAQTAGYQLLIADNFSTGHKSLCRNVDFCECDTRAASDVSLVFQRFQPDWVVHFAALSLVQEAQEKPELYYENNVEGTRNIIAAAVAHKVKGFIFSSSAAVYGNQSALQKEMLLSETADCNPLNAYGETKLAAEKLLQTAFENDKLNSLSLRYFNAAGAHPNLPIGEMHKNETHLIPNIFLSLQNKKPLQLFGNDFDTADGTCIRDYIHVCDLATGHLSGIKYLQNKQGAFVMNLGTGQGYSVMEVINSCASSANLGAIDFTIAPRRAGDPATLVADITRAKSELGFAPQFSSLDNITKTAYNWHGSKQFMDFINK